MQEPGFVSDYKCGKYRPSWPGLPLPDAGRDLTAVPVCFDCNSLDVDARRRRVLMIQSLLRLEEAARLFGHDPRVGVTGLVDMDVRDVDLPGIDLQVLGERARGERGARLPRPVMPRPQRPLRADYVVAPGGREVLG